MLTTATAPGIRGAKAGARIPVWLARSGQPVAPPGGQVAMIVSALAPSTAVAGGAWITLLVCDGCARSYSTGGGWRRGSPRGP